MESIALVADQFYAAAAGLADWESALASLADATGSRAGQLIGLGAPAVLMNRVSGMPQELHEEFVAINGGDPAVNRRVAAGINAPLLKTLSEEDFASPEELARDPHYADFCARYDIPNICLTTLVRSDDRVVGLSVLRSKKQGAIDRDNRRIFAALAPRIQGAVQVRMTLEAQGARTLATGFEAAGIAAFIVDSQGAALSSTAQAIEFAARGSHVTLKRNIVGAVLHADDLRLRGAIAQADKPGAVPQALTVSAIDGRQPLLVDILPLPREAEALGFRATALIVVGLPDAGRQRGSALLRSAFTLTAAEADVIAALVGSEGDIESVASARGVSVGTIRNQMKSIYSKLGVRRQAELFHLVRPFL